MKPTQEQIELIQKIQTAILKAEDTSYKERLLSANFTANSLSGIIYKWLGANPSVTDLVKPATRAERKNANEALKGIGYKMTIRTKGDLLLVDLIEILYWQAVRDATTCEGTIELLKIELEEMTGNRPTDGGTFTAEERKKSLQEQGVAIGSALFSVLKSGLIQGQTTVEIEGIIKDTYLRRSQAGYKKVLYTADTYYQNKALTPDIEVKPEDEPVPEDDEKRDGGVIRKKKDEREYLWLTMRDGKVCGDCMALDGRVFKYSEAVEGVTYPPLHPNCRCVAIEVKEKGAE